GGSDTAMPVQGDEDWDLWLTLVERGYRGIILPEVLFQYRRRAGSMSAVAWYGPGHMPLAQYRVAKHEASYRSHLLDVLLRQDVETVALLRRNDELERHLTTFLEPGVAARRQELADLRARMSADATDRIQELESAARAAYAEVDALRASKSWRVTAPGREAYEGGRPLRGGA